MFNRLVVIGVGAHGKVIADVALKNGYTDFVFVDDDAVGSCMNYLVICQSSNIKLRSGITLNYFFAYTSERRCMA